jgi:pimeloyl-ACP methyl ester carboxylesterase
MRSLVVVLGAGLLLASGSARERGRPLVLLLHGRGMLGQDSAATRQFWFRALTAGGRTLTSRALITEGDVRVVWYADVLDPRSGDACDYAPTDRRAQRERAEDPTVRDLVGAVGMMLGVLTSAIDDTLASGGLRSLAADASFLSDARKRCAAESRLDLELDRARAAGRPIILVAHSLGSLVAYDLLSSRSDTGLVRRFVTMGSPIGSTGLRHLLIGGDSTDTLAMPRGVHEWVNIRNEGDVFATSLPIGREVVEAPPPDEPDPHEMVGYLRSSTAAKEILGAWCAAFSTDRPPGCKDVGSN